MTRSKLRTNRNLVVSIIILGIITSGILGLNVFLATQSENVSFEVMREGRFIKIDYEPKTILDQDWDLTLWSVQTTEGEGDWEVEYYPFIESWKLIVQDFNDNLPIADQNYRLPGEELIPPNTEIAVTIDDFTTEDFEKGIITLKLRAEVFCVNKTITDRIDFNLELEGSATYKDVIFFIGIPYTICVIAVTCYLVKNKLDKHFIERITYWNFPKYLLKWFTRRSR